MIKFFPLQEEVRIQLGQSVGDSDLPTTFFARVLRNRAAYYVLRRFIQVKINTLVN
jgi:hypothetical protein